MNKFPDQITLYRQLMVSHIISTCHLIRYHDNFTFKLRKLHLSSELFFMALLQLSCSNFTWVPNIFLSKFLCIFILNRERLNNNTNMKYVLCYGRYSNLKGVPAFGKTSICQKFLLLLIILNAYFSHQTYIYIYIYTHVYIYVCVTRKKRAVFKKHMCDIRTRWVKL